jgi:stress response protein SCP2
MVKLFMPYAEANAVRVRFAEAESSKGVVVSALHRHDTGWSFMACGACLATGASDDERGPDQ